MSKKNPQNHETRAESLAKLRANPEFAKKMRFVREEFYPALCEATTSVDDASMLLYGFNNQIMEQFLGFMKEKKVSDLGLYEKLDSKSGKYEESKRLLDLFQDLSVFEAKEYIEGLKGEIETWKQDMFREKPLKDLPTLWLDELK